MGPGLEHPTEMDVEAAAARWFFQNSDDLFIVIRAGQVAYVNPTWTRLTGWGVEDAIGRRLTDFAHPEETEAIAAAVRELQTTGGCDTEHRIKTKAGEWRWFRSRATRPSERAALIVSCDITEERARQNDRDVAQRANELLRTAAGVFVWRFNPDTGVYTVDPDLSRPVVAGTVATVHKDGSRTLTYELMNAQFHPDDRDMMVAAISHCIRTGEQQICSYRHWYPERKVWATLRATWRGMRQLPSGKWEVFGITHDMTEVAMARDAALRGEQAAQAAAEAKSQFLANMSHEIRTPMNGVLGVLHLLKNEELTPEGRHLITEALGCGQMLSELLNDIIDFSKIEAGRLELAPEAVDPAALLASVAGLLRPQAEARGLWLRTDVPPDMGWAGLDPVRLRQVLFNLIGNAVKFTLVGGVEVRLAYLDEGAGRRLRIEVEDTGVGIPKEAREGLFERFHQADNSMTRRFGGSGLGLAITRRLAHLMGGDVGFTSRDGAGSVFWVELAAPPAGAIKTIEESCGLLLDGLHVLVVEDNATNRLIATKMLENLGAQVETAEDGLQGLEAVKRSQFDLVFMDVQMPVMDGVEATRRIRALAEPAGEVAIIAMTANAMAHQRDSYLAAGMNGGVAKPLSPAALITEIAAVVTSGRSVDVAAA